MIEYSVEKIYEEIDKMIDQVSNKVRLISNVQIQNDNKEIFSSLLNNKEYYKENLLYRDLLESLIDDFENKKNIDFKNQVLIRCEVILSAINEKINNRLNENRSFKVCGISIDSKNYERIYFEKRSLLNQIEINKVKYEKGEMIILKDENNVPIKQKKSYIKMPKNSKYSGYIFETTLDVKEKNNNILFVELSKNFNNYVITRTKKMKNKYGIDLKNKEGKIILDFKNQDKIKMSGTELIREFEKNKLKIQNFEKGGLGVYPHI
ncbi:hypothetical protein [Finegoldia magna]|uniref:hypothetical protein n=1 Tax=Finegoldia magna TaxID=1260 RepID=UPI00290B4E38|nr:hypothetical protein [Finegoldia magna]MDU5508212.1 hypothetical protein [Finegoldia magna]